MASEDKKHKTKPIEDSIKKDLNQIFQLLQEALNPSTSTASKIQKTEQAYALLASLPNEKLQALTKHLKGWISGEKKNPVAENLLQNILVPIERELKKNITDPDLFITTNDRTIEKSKTSSPLPVIFVLDHLRSAFNVGSIIRTLDTLGCTSMALVGYTPGLDHEAVQKTAMGAHEHLQAQSFSRLDEALIELKKQGYKIIAIETVPHSKNIYADAFISAKEKIKTAFILGNERFGIASEDLKLVDEVYHIPTYGFKNSLNVAVTAALVGFEWRRQYEV